MVATAGPTGSGVRRETSRERRERIGQLTQSDIKRHKQPDARSLSDAVASGGLITSRQLRALEVPHDAPVISLYLTLAPDPPQPAIAPLTAFHSMRHTELAAREQYVIGLDRYARMRLDRDLEEFAEVLEALPDSGLRSLVVFKSGEELNRAVRLPLRVRDRLVIAADPFVEPLAVILDTYSKALVVLIEKNSATFWTHQLGHEVDVHELEAAFTSDDADRSLPGKADRQRETHLHWHLRATIQAMSSLMARYDCDVNVIAGDEEVVAELEALLPNALRTTLAGVVHPSAHGLDIDRAALVDGVLAEYRGRVETAGLDDLGLFAGHGLLVSGLRDVLDAVNDFRARRLFLSDALAAPGYYCREHNYLSVDAGRCPWDDTELLPTESVVDELVEFTQQHGVELMLVVRRQDLLESHRGIAGVLYPPA